MTIPVLVPPTTPELAAPYLTPGGFAAYPTWLDLDNLIPGGVAALQEQELADALLSASDWAVGVVENMPLHAHWVQGENVKTRTTSSGRAVIQPRHVPVRAVTALAWGADPSQMTSDTLPDASMWITDGKLVQFTPGGGFVQYRGPALQFGPVTRPARELYVTWSYVAGFPNTTIATAAAPGATSVTVADPAGILPGDVLRIYDPGDTSVTAAANEAITVASTWSPALPTVPPTQTAIPLAAGTTLAYAHEVGIGITGFPRKVIQAVIAYTVALLMREDVSAEEPVGAFGPAARTVGGQRGGQAAGLVNDAIGWLSPYRPVLRS